MHLGISQTKKSCFSVFTRLICVFVIAANTSSAVSASSLTDISLQNAERLLQFKVMIRATYRRCEILKEPFDREYKVFYKSFKDKLEVSSKVVKLNFSGTHDIQSFDSMLTATANTYGMGHPQHNCRQLKAEVAKILEMRSDADLFVAIDRMLVGTPKHDHYSSNIASAVSDRTSLITASSSEIVKLKSASEPKPQPLDNTTAVVDKPFNASGSSASPVKSGSTQEYTGGSRIKDF
jgi:hypothetical protein